MKRKIEFPIEIPLSKTKMMLLFIGAVVFVFLGLALILFEPESINYSNRHAWIMKPIPRFFVGFVCVIFFGPAAATMLVRLFNKKQGLIINEKGVYDNSSALALGFIPWEDISEIKMITVNNNNFILILVHNPLDYLNKTTQWFKLRGQKMNYRHYETPICISAVSLQIKSEELYKLLIEHLNHFRNS